MRFAKIPVLVACLVGCLALPSPAQDGDAKRSLVYRNDRYLFEVQAPPGWTKELDGAKAAGRWVDLVAYRHAGTGARLQVSAQASAHPSFETLLADRRDYYGKLKSIVVERGPETLSPRMGVRPRGVYVSYRHGSDKAPHRGFTAYYLSGGSVIRLYGTVLAEKFDDVSATFEAFGGSLRILARDVGAEKPNFVHDASRLALVFPPNWTVRIPARDAVASFRHELGGVTITVHVETGERDLETFVRNRVAILKASDVGDLESKGLADHAARGEQAGTIEYTQGRGDQAFAYREICLDGGGARYVRVVLSGRKAQLEHGRDALDRMVASVRFTGR